MKLGPSLFPHICYSSNNDSPWIFWWEEVECMSLCCFIHVVNATVLVQTMALSLDSYEISLQLYCRTAGTRLTRDLHDYFGERNQSARRLDAYNHVVHVTVLLQPLDRSLDSYEFFSCIYVATRPFNLQFMSRNRKGCVPCTRDKSFATDWRYLSMNPLCIATVLISICRLTFPVLGSPNQRNRKFILNHRLEQRRKKICWRSKAMNFLHNLCWMVKHALSFSIVTTMKSYKSVNLHFFL
jgi:hypothetical protein